MWYFNRIVIPFMVKVKSFILVLKGACSSSRVVCTLSKTKNLFQKKNLNVKTVEIHINFTHRFIRIVKTIVEKKNHLSVNFARMRHIKRQR